MEDERFRELLERVINFNWDAPRPRPSELRAEFEERKIQSLDSWRASTDEAEKKTLWDKYKAPAPAAVRAEYDEIRKPRREFQRALRRDFPEWHYSDGSRVGEFVGGRGNSTPPEMREAWDIDTSIQFTLRKVWKLASTGDADKAKRELRKISEHFVLKAERALSKAASYSMLGKRKKEVVTREPRPKEAATLRQMVETLEWLQRRLGSLKVCENPKCSSGRKYFFKVYPNDRYCCARCIAKAKALRQAKRDAESQKPPRVPLLPEETRKKMAESASKRWDKYRAKTGKLKYERS